MWTPGETDTGSRTGHNSLEDSQFFKEMGSYRSQGEVLDRIVKKIQESVFVGSAKLVIMK